MIDINILSMDSSENISFFFTDNDTTCLNDDSLTNIYQLMDEFKELPNDTVIPHSSLESYTIAELLKICEYYGLLKGIKMAKYKKQDIVHAIKIFEESEENQTIVLRRLTLWFYIDELLADKKMKKYIIWK